MEIDLPEILRTVYSWDSRRLRRSLRSRRLVVCGVCGSVEDFGSDKFGKELLWFDSLFSLTVFLVGLTIFAMLLFVLAAKIEPPRRGSKETKSNSAAKTDFTSLKLGD